MEEEIDLRPYIQTLIRYAKWIFSTSIIFAVVTFFAVRLLPEIYESTTLVILLDESDTFRFDPRIQQVTNNEPINALPELAMSSDLLLELLQDEALSNTDIKTLDDLRGILKAETGSDKLLIRLIVQHPEKSLTAQIANRWAEIFITRINSIYGRQNNNKVAFFQEQLAQSKTELEMAESDLIQFQQINRMAIISNTLSFLNQEQTLNLTNQQSLDRLLQDSEYLRDQISNLPSGNSSTFSDQLTALNIQLEAFNLDTATPILLQLDANIALIGSTTNEHIFFLDRLIDLLQFKLSTIQSRLDKLDPEVLTLQQQLQETSLEMDRLVRNHMIAEEAYISLARKVQEEQITSQDTQTGLRLVSRAAIPDESESRSVLLFTALAGVAGMILSAVFILIRAWWHQNLI